MSRGEMSYKSIKPVWALRAAFALALLATLWGGATQEQRTQSAMSVTLAPNSVIAGARATVRLTFVVASDSVKINGGVKARLPKGFSAPQNSEANAANYVAASTSNPRARIVITQISRTDAQVNWGAENNAWVVTALVQEHGLARGDTLHLTFGANAPSGQIKAPYSNFSDSVRVACDANGNGFYHNLSPGPVLTITTRPPYRLAAYLPSSIVAGARATLKLVALDELNNLAASFTGKVQLTSTDASASFPGEIVFTADDSGRKNLEAVFQTAGIHTMSAVALDRTPRYLWQTRSNPAEVAAAAESLRIFWGDLHNHSGFSYDGYGYDAFFAAREIAALDFFALTDHASFFLMNNSGLSASEWEATKREVVRFNQPGAFVTIPAYEFSATPPSGHHNVYFNAPDELVPSLPLWRDEDYGQIQKVWQAKDNVLPRSVDMITIPHHTGILWNGVEGMGSVVSFGLGFGDAKLRPLIEIFSGHGLSEAYAPEHALSYKNLSPASDKAGSTGPHYAQDAWAANETLGVIAASDDHGSRPGQHYNGLAAVYAKELTRDAIFDALKNRRTYATTGQRMLVHFDIDGQLMGSQLLKEPPYHPRLSVRVAGTDDLEFVEVLKWDRRRGLWENGHPRFEIIHRREGEGPELATQYVDSSYAGAAIYYARAKQRNDVFIPRQRLARQVWAWTSPIWMNDAQSLDTAETNVVPRRLQLERGFPNPFQTSAIVRYYLPRRGEVQANLYNALGQLLRPLLHETQSEGWHGLRVTGFDLAQGIYFVHLQAAGEQATQKIVLLRIGD
jgi:hypothetical protein